MQPMKFRKKPVVIEAVQWVADVSGTEDVGRWCGAVYNANRDVLIIPTLEGDHAASRGDWIIKGVAGEFYPCKDHVFQLSYEPAEEGDES